jgi:spore maturation protein CgeB
MEGSSRKILYVGDLWYGSTALWRRQALTQLGFEIDSVDTSRKTGWFWIRVYNFFHKMGVGLDLVGANRKIMAFVAKTNYKFVWIDKGLTIRPGVLRRVKMKDPSTMLISYSPDDMFNPINQTKRYLRSIKEYDKIITTKSFNVTEFKEMGAKVIHFVSNSYDPAVHKPMQLNATEMDGLAAEVGFIGNIETARLNSILFLVKNGVTVSVTGPPWHKWKNVYPNLKIDPVFRSGADYAKAISATKINLGFLFKGNRDQQTQRSIEIPACGGFLLAERTDEHLSLFQEGVEAEFFSSDEELLSKIKFYLKHEELRKSIAAAGYRRCLSSKYDYASIIESCLNY